MVLVSRMLLALALASLGLISCRKEQPSENPSENMQRHISVLADKLTAHKGGWALTYFSRCDSLIFTTPNAYIGHRYFRGAYGYGGHYYTMRFEGNTVEMLADYDQISAQTPVKSEYTIGRNTSTQLSFVLDTYLHRIVNDRYRGSSDLLYQGVDDRGALIFTTTTYANAGHEYIRLEPLPESTTASQAMSEALANRLHWENMVNPQIRISQGGRTYYQSRYYIKRKVETNMSLLEEILQKRYYVFFSPMLPDEWREDYEGFSVLGSGYVGTKEGLTFRPGIILNSRLRFCAFERVGDKYVAELVTVYDPVLRSERLESKHLYPDGIPTGYIAEIWDEEVRN